MLYSELGTQLAYVDMCANCASAIGLTIGQVGNFNISIQYDRAYYSVTISTPVKPYDMAVDPTRARNITVTFGAAYTYKFDIDERFQEKKYGISNIQTVPVLRRC